MISSSIRVLQVNLNCSPPATELALLAEGSIFADFVAYLRGQSSPALLPGEAIAATRICLLARQAADERRIITI